MKDRDAFFMAIATMFGTRSTCNRGKVGAIAVRENRVISSGYVGAPAGLAHCTEAGCKMLNGHCINTVHAEANVMAFAARSGLPLEGSTLYTTHSPCLNCAKMLVNTGIFRVVFGIDYGDTDAVNMLAALGVELDFIDTSPEVMGGSEEPELH